MPDMAWNAGSRCGCVTELTVAAKVENIEKATAFVNEYLNRTICTVKARTWIAIAIDEVISNIAHYAYPSEDGDVTIQVALMAEPDTAVITFIDNGIPYDPLKTADPDTTLPAEERNFGGLGIYMLKKTMDEITYRYENGSNILTIYKKLRS